MHRGLTSTFLTIAAASLVLPPGAAAAATAATPAETPGVGVHAHQQATSASASTGTGARVAKVRRPVSVDYGDGPVKSTTGRVLKVAFDDKKGHRVRLQANSVSGDWPRQCPIVRLLRDGDEVDTKHYDWDTRMWRLPMRDLYTFKVRNRRKNTLAVKAQLLKLRVHDVGIGERVRLPKERGFVSAARVRVPREGMVMVRTTPHRLRFAKDQGQVVVPGQTAKSFYFGPDSLSVEGHPVTIPNLLLKAEQPVRYLHPYFGSGDVRPSAADLRASKAVLVLPTGDVKVTVNRPQLTTTTVDGPGLTVTAEPRGKMLTQATFTTAGPQWLRLQVHVEGQVQDRLTPWSSGGVEVVASVNTTVDGAWAVSPIRELVQVPAAGTHNLRLFVRTTDGTRKDVTVRLRPVRTLPAMPTDGTGVEFATTQPGEWVLAPVELDPARTYRVDASNVAVSRTAGWFGLVQPPVRIGCRDIYCSAPSAHLNSERLSGDGLKVVANGPNPWFALFAPAPDVTGSLTYALTPTS